MEFLSGDSKNLPRGEGGDVGLGARSSKNILGFLFGYLFLNSTLFISYFATIVHLYILDIVCVLILVIIKENY